GPAADRRRRRRPGAAHAGRRVRRRPDRRRDLGSLRDPGLPHAGHGHLGERRPDGGRAHRRLAREPRALLELLRRALPDPGRQAAQRRPPRARAARAPRAARRCHHAEHRHAAPARRHARADRGPRLDRDVLVPFVRTARRLRRRARAAARRGGAAVRLRAAAQARCRPVRRVSVRGGARACDAARRGRRPAAVHRHLRWRSIRSRSFRGSRCATGATSRSSRRARRRTTVARSPGSTV
ncbi:MAG: NAD-dependent protein deacetylase of SIR2 family, partial [uncultured Solirubrobacteraceae bacterium]